MRMASVRWLNAEEERTWRTFVRVMRLLSADLERDLQREAKLPLTYYEILMALSETPGRALRMSELAQILQVSPSRLSHAIDRMEESGWVRRQPCPSDRRGWIALLTDDGYAVLEAAAPYHVESVRTHLFDQLGPAQVEQLGQIADALLRHLSPNVRRPHEAGAVPPSPER